MATVNIEKMAQELGIRSDLLRIKLGRPTSKQRDIRNAQTFPDIVSLYPLFVDDRGNSCGPKYEEVEKDEYWAKRAELFEEYMKGFTTVESFAAIPDDTNHQYTFLTNVEVAEATKRLNALLAPSLEKARSAEAVCALYAALQAFEKKKKAKHLYTHSTEQRLLENAKRLFVAELRNAKSLADAIAVFKAWTPLAHDLASGEGFERHGHNRERAYSWASVWKLAQSPEDVFLIESSIDKRFIDSDYNGGNLGGHLQTLIRERFEKFDNFKEALVAAQTLSSRDKKYDGSRSINPDSAYTEALWSLVRLIETRADMTEFLKVWRERSSKCSGDNRLRDPHGLDDKWDMLYLSDVEAAGDDLDALEKFSKASYGRQTSSAAYARIEEILSQAVSPITDLDELGKFEGRYAKYSYHVREFVAAQRVYLKRKRALLNLESSEDKRVLIGLVHEFKDEPELAKRALLKLARHFPAEEVEEIEVEVK